MLRNCYKRVPDSDEIELIDKSVKEAPIVQSMQAQPRNLYYDLPKDIREYVIKPFLTISEAECKRRFDKVIAHLKRFESTFDFARENCDARGFRYYCGRLTRDRDFRRCWRCVLGVSSCKNLCMSRLRANAQRREVLMQWRWDLSSFIAAVKQGRKMQHRWGLTWRGNHPPTLRLNFIKKMKMPWKSSASYRDVFWEILGII